MTSKISTIGVSRSIMYKFLELKKTNAKLNDSGGNLLANQIPNYKLLNNSSRESSNIVSVADNNNNDIIDIFEKTNKIYSMIEANFTKLQEEQQRRLMPRFNEDENIKISQGINILVHDITQNLSVCERNIKQLSQTTSNNTSEEKLKSSMKINLTTKLKDITNKIRKNEEHYLAKYRDLGFDESSRTTPSEKSKNDFLEMSMTDNILKKRDVEINELVKSINDLSHIFKEMSNLVNEQGKIICLHQELS